MAQDVCSVERCGGTGPFRHTFCKKHYSRWKRHGDPLGGTPSYRFPESLLRRLAFMPDGCIEYSGAKQGGGYGFMRINGKNCLAHRVSYELVRGPIPDGLELDHLCRNRACVNPGHLEPVTHQVNIQRARAAAA